MADRETDLTARIAPAVAALEASTWDRLAGGDPLTSHAFLELLETSASVGPGTGWTPLPILATRGGGEAVAAAPAYLKTHSQGEYVFDHGWAEAWQRAGGAYYPKLQVAVPFTPCPGRRLLGDAGAALAALEAIAVNNHLSSAHVTFCGEDEAQAAEARGWLLRHGLQFHWFNRGYSSFDDFLAALSSRKRKAIRKERAAACAGLDILTLRGADIRPEHWLAMWGFYQDTGRRKWGEPYLTRAWFEGAGAVLGTHALMFLALRDGVPVAGALNILGEDVLYGRYWGCAEEIPFLHFELSYYKAIEFAIAHGTSTVQAGAQGEHKLARGYEPVVTRSVHFIPDPGFRSAIADFLVRERQAIAAELDWCREALPYRSA